MITIHDIEVKKAFRGGKYWDSFYETKLKVRLADSYSDLTISLTEDQTAKIVDQILEFAKSNLTFEHHRLDPPKEDAVDEPAPLVRDAA